MTMPNKLRRSPRDGCETQEHYRHTCASGRASITRVKKKIYNSLPKTAMRKVNLRVGSTDFLDIMSRRIGRELVKAVEELFIFVA